MSKEYDSWIQYIHTQMDVNMKHYDFPSDKGHNNNKSQAWRNTDLSNLWKEARAAERALQKNKGDYFCRQKLFQEFRVKRKLFDT